jgi:hypothetical protein
MKKCENFRTFFYFDTTCQNAPIPLHHESNRNRKTISNMIAILFFIGLVANVLNYIFGGKKNIF